MTLIEMFTLLGIGLGTLVGGIVGGLWFGAWGIAGGIPVGLVGGYVVGNLCGLLGEPILLRIATRSIQREKSEQRRALEEHFGKYWTKTRSGAWARIPRDTLIGSTVSGRIVASHFHGVYVDVGVGFPARLPTNVDGNSNAPLPLGKDITGVVEAYDESRRIILLGVEDDQTE